MLERDFQGKLIKEIKARFDGCIVTKLDSSHIQGIPDLLILHGSKWAVLECKKSGASSFRPNQKYYLERMDKMSFARAIYPENMEVILNELQRSFKT